MIDRNVEEALNLRSVQVERQYAIGARSADQIRDQFRRDRHAWLVLAVLARVAVVRNDRRDATRRGALERVEHDQQLHQIVVHRWRRRLDHEDVRAADVLIDLHVVLAVGEAVQRDAARLDLELAADFLRERRVRSSGENLQGTVQGAEIISTVASGAMNTARSAAGTLSIAAIHRMSN